MAIFVKGGVGCSISCRCEGCKNTFGRKDGTFADVKTNYFSRFNFNFSISQFELLTCIFIT